MPVTKFSVPEKYRYQNGFGSYHEYVLQSAGSSHVKLTVVLGLKPSKGPFL